jgi:hypothetical protein
MHLHHDLYREATDRRHRDTEEWTRSRSLQRDARLARERHVAPSRRRMRLMVVASPMVAILALVLAGGAIG